MVTKRQSEIQTAARVRRQLASGEARELVRSARLRRSELAAVLNVTPSTVWLWLNGRRSPSLEHALALARVLDDLAAGEPLP